ncbi:nucleotide-binding protein [Chengkuizengella axinellae]|uniref:Nucleotide-binding protein n=1 Tax=Chengkuizengella axinellae TaxID=3064388 RepID=A0ABT9IWR3_9BACL|nr:nucleotide-binding protein [Chengkuizengella sp. 2205SS18-9]MDP5273225.1 nucleotide-binding protein [Chengkuizengella sp. 2205SS18-9]
MLFPSSNKIFIVHGHDEEMKLNVARTVERLNLEAIILHEYPDRGRTVIEKLMDESADVSFAIILLSPDDVGRAKDSQEDSYRARQNVVLELGMFIGKLGRDRVLTLLKESDNFEKPSDIAGVIYTKYDGSNGWMQTLVTELKACGFDIDANLLFK